LIGFAGGSGVSSSKRSPIAPMAGLLIHVSPARGL
jgi:hypothetical protein